MLVVTKKNQADSIEIGNSVLEVILTVALLHVFVILTVPYCMFLL